MKINKIMKLFFLHKKEIFKISAWILIFLLGAGAGILAYKAATVKNACISNYKFINSEPGCEISEEENLQDISSLNINVNNLIESAVQNSEAMKISIFFRDLVTKRWFGINENDQYKAGSLLKLPLLMAYYKISEIDNSIFSKEIKYVGNNEISKLEDIKSGIPLEKGKIYSVSKLLEKMIIDSDNDASDFLFYHIDSQLLDKIYTDLQIYNLTSKGLDKSYISVRNYGNLFRILYNASYLTREASDKILELLAKTTFNDGLVAGVPSDILIAHKFGDRTYMDENNQVIERTLNDCGIVYASNHPYILCVATQGMDLKKLENIIKNISNIVYKTTTD